MTITQFLRAMKERFENRARIAPENSLDLALSALETWEDAGEPVELTESCAHEIVDTELQHWEAD